MQWTNTWLLEKEQGRQQLWAALWDKLKIHIYCSCPLLYLDFTKKV